MKTTRERIAGLTAIEYKRKSQEDKSNKRKVKREQIK